MALANGSGNGGNGGIGDINGIQAGGPNAGGSAGASLPPQGGRMPMRMSRRSFLATAGLLAGGALLGLAGCGAGASAGSSADTGGAAVSKVTIGHLTSTAQTVVGERKGFFAEEFAKDNVEVEFVQFPSGPLVIEAMKAGDVTFGTSAAQPVLTSNANGTNLKFFCSYKTTEKGNALVVSDASGIKALADLKGKRLGYTVGTTLHNLTIKVLAEAGLSEGDVELMNMQVGDIVTSLKSGDLDGGFIWEPMITTLTAAGGFSVLRDGTGLLLEYCGMIADNDFLQQNASLAVRFVNAMETSRKWIGENVDEAVSIIAEVSGNSDAGVRALLEKSDISTGINDADLKGIDDTAGFLKDNDMIPDTIPAEKVVDLDILKQAGVA